MQQETVITPQGTRLPLMQLSGKNYMTVQWRVVWFREEKPLWSIETESVTLTPEIAIFKAWIKDENGRIVSMAHGSETLKGFPAGFIEKAETVAIGRALANIGYATAFAAELDSGDKLADSPVIPKSSSHSSPRQPSDAMENMDGGHYIVTFGKFKGQSFQEIGLSEIKNYKSYIERKAREDNKPVQGAVLEFLQAANLYIEEEDRLPI